MSKTPLHIQGLSEAIESLQRPFVKVNKIAAPFTTVRNRALVTDFSNDMLPRLGVERFTVNRAVPAQGESGPNGEKVWRPTNDIHERCRFVDRSGVVSAVSNSGQYVFGGDTSSYVEITFYGTGLNMLSILYNTASTQLSYSVDGGGFNVITSFSPSSVLDGRNYNANQLTPIVSGLALGMHTVRILGTGGNIYFQGYEIITGTSTLSLTPGTAYSGGVELAQAAQELSTYNVVDIGSLNATKGGRVVVYIDKDGSIKKAGTPTDATQLNGPGSASHVNEDVIRTYHWREFGAGRADDLTTTQTGSSPLADRLFTLDDNCTAIVAQQLAVSNEGMFPNNSGQPINFTFVGTGIDVIIPFTSTSTTVTFSIDGTVVYSATNPTVNQVLRLASGLPYGTHTLTYTHTGGGVPTLRQFVVYGPKKPTLPDGAVELADYFVTASYQFTDTPSDPRLHSRGVIMKSLHREAVYVGTWAFQPFQATYPFGQPLITSTTGNYMEYTFFGTGFEFLTTYSTSGTNIRVSIDGALYTGAATVNAGGPSWTPGSSVFQLNTIATPKLSVQGLTLGVHRVRFEYLSGGTNIQPAQFGVITPIHSVKDASYVTQNAATIGNCGVRDQRQLVFSDGSNKGTETGAAQADGISLAPTQAASTLATIPDMVTTIVTKGGSLDISWAVTALQSANNVSATFNVYVNGQLAGAQKSFHGPGANNSVTTSDRILLQVPPGTYTIQLLCGTDAASTLTFRSNYRSLSVKELAA